MVDRFVQSLSLLILLSVSGLNGGLSTKMSFTVAAGGAAGIAGDAAIEKGGSAWRASYLPLMLARPGLRCSGTCAEDTGDPNRQVPCSFDAARLCGQEGSAHHLKFSSNRARRDGDVGVGGGGGHGTRSKRSTPHSETALWSAARMRGGEVDRNPDVSQELAESAKSLRSPHDTAKAEAISSSPSPWLHAPVSKGPRSFSSYSDAEVVITPTTDFDVDRGSPAATASKARDTTTTHFVSECSLPTARGNFRLRAYRHEGNGRSLEPVVMVAEGLTDLEGVPVRVHDQCLTSEVLGSLRCDCKQQLELALDYIAEHGGCVIYMQQEGRGIGLANKVAAYALQDGGLDTVDANRHLGFDDDLRSYEAVEYILSDMGIKSVKLMTNNPFKLKCLKAMGIKILSRIPMLVAPNAHSLAYLRAKAHRMSHFLHQLDDVEIMGEPPLNGAAAPVALPLDEVGAIRGGVKSPEIEVAREEEGEGEGDEDEEYAFGKDSVLAAIQAVREGKCVVVTDDERRENEGDLVFAAEKSTEDLLAFTIRHSSGVICASMEEERLEELRLPQMVEDNEDPKMTAFTVSVDAKLGTTTGISAGDRAITLRSLADSKSSPHDFNRPGHIFPLRYTAGGVLKRGGHTEAAVDLAKLAGLSPVGVLCEITTKDGKHMARVPELREFCAEHGLVLTSIQDLRCLIRERQRAETLGRNGPASRVLTR